MNLEYYFYYIHYTDLDSDQNASRKANNNRTIPLKMILSAQKQCFIRSA